MRIAFLVASFSPLSQTFVYDRILELTRQGHDVYVITMDRELTTERPFERVYLLKRPAFSRRVAMKIKKQLATVRRKPNDIECIKYASDYRRRMSELLLEIKPDILHAEFGPMGALYAPLANQTNLPLVVFMHGYDVTKLGKQDQWRRWYAAMWRNTALVLTPSEFMREQVIALGAQPEHVQVLHNGIDTSNWTFSDPSSRFDGRRVTFLFVGRMVEKKGPLQLVRAFDTCRKQLHGALEPELVLCGDGPLYSHVETLIDQLGLTGSVRLLGASSHAQVRAEMQKAHILVQHSVTAESGDMEGLPVSLTEAAAVGLPIIATRHSGIPEIVREGLNGFLVDENDIEAMAARMVELAQTPKLWSEFGRAGRDLIEREFEQRATVATYVHLVNECGLTRWPDVNRQRVVNHPREKGSE